MYLSRLILDPRSREARRDLSDCQQLHRTILSAFPPKDDGEGGAREAFGVLYRVETERRTGAVALLVQSAVEPDWRRLPAGYLAEDGGENPACKGVGETLRSIQTGTRLAFRLRANPTRRVSTRNERDGARWHGRRVELRGEEEQVEWLRRKGEAQGFQLVDVSARADAPNVRARRETKLTGRRKGEGNGRLSFGSVLFEGELTVTDAELFRQAVERGVGPGKAYGFGLLSLARARGCRRFTSSKRGEIET